MRFTSLFTTVAVLLLSQSAFAVQIADVTRMQGSWKNVLTGMGLVTGLRGTGDGTSYKPTVEALTRMLARVVEAPVTVTAPAVVIGKPVAAAKFRIGAAAVADSHQFKANPIAISLGWVGVCLLLNGWLRSLGSKKQLAGNVI